MDFEEHLIQSQLCVLAFASGADRFEWGRTLSGIKTSYVLLRDRSERWYQGGVAGIGDKPDVVLYVADIVARYDAVVTMGLSSGSYAALMYGRLGGVDVIFAISPITGKGDALKADFEPRWHHRIEHGPEHPPVPDLKPLFNRMATPFDPTMRAFVSDGEGTELDRRMAERIGMMDVTLIPGYSHSGLARHMRDSGLIRRMLS